MPFRSADVSATGGRKRYIATVEKGENVWRQEWNSFMSGITLKRLREGTSGVALKPSADLERQETSGDNPPTFSYLFSSPAEKKAARAAILEQQRAELRKRRRQGRGEAEDGLSNHQRAIREAQQRGLKLDNMSRKEQRAFLHLTVSKEQQEAEERAKNLKLHELMDARVAWYQQGPHPVDLIAEKLVVRKAEKKARQLGLRYNYLAPHPSWIAKRAQKRRDSMLVSLGRRVVFDDEGNAFDPLYSRPVDINNVGIASRQSTFPQSAVSHSHETHAACESTAPVKKDDRGQRTQVMNVSGPTYDEPMNRAAAAPASKAPAEVIDLSNILVDPLSSRNLFVRSVVKSRKAALAIKNANLSTNFLSSSLIKGPSIAPDDATEVSVGAPVMTVPARRSVKKDTISSVKRRRRN